MLGYIGLTICICGIIALSVFTIKDPVPNRGGCNRPPSTPKPDINIGTQKRPPIVINHGFDKTLNQNYTFVIIDDPVDVKKGDAVFLECEVKPYESN